MKNILLTVCPYLSLVILFIVFFMLGTYVTNDHLSGLFLSISANSIFVFIAYFTYEMLVLKSKKELNKELIMYEKHTIDADIFNILYTISKVLNPPEKANNVLYISNLMKMKKKEIMNIIGNKEYLGFQLFKDWNQTRTSFYEFLQNNFVLIKFDNNYLINIMKIRNYLTLLEYSLFNTNNLILLNNQKDLKNLKVVKVLEIDPKTETPNKYILLKNIDNTNKAIIKDFGDFDDTYRERLIAYYKIKQEIIEEISIIIYNLLRWIKRWIKTTGGYDEFMGFADSVLTQKEGMYSKFKRVISK